MAMESAISLSLSSNAQNQFIHLRCSSLTDRSTQMGRGPHLSGRTSIFVTWASRSGLQDQNPIASSLDDLDPTIRPYWFQVARDINLSDLKQTLAHSLGSKDRSQSGVAPCSSIPCPFSTVAIK